jgi:hypothetical protein
VLLTAFCQVPSLQKAIRLGMFAPLWVVGTLVPHEIVKGKRIV